ncbi:hypothetical protein K2173_023514 [Erythroxylum novogranatense]|uniref:RING-type domain-containing protein n=1 Tax=Erythroxylum novogranatense TaxID=1862640 RepID=A0AAV8TNU3_9ROSI|nr:hypothetical protein K2173_023514 [Erythroxylum novogranatense]
MAISPQSHALSSCLIGASFDLDDALTLPANFGHQVTVSNSLVSNMPRASTDDVCTVCLETFQPENMGRRSPCGHVYHAACIFSWLCHRNSCPLCRYNISGDP